MIFYTSLNWSVHPVPYQQRTSLIQTDFLKNGLHRIEPIGSTRYWFEPSDIKQFGLVWCGRELIRSGSAWFFFDHWMRFFWIFYCQYGPIRYGTIPTDNRHGILVPSLRTLIQDLPRDNQCWTKTCLYGFSQFHTNILAWLLGILPFN